MKLLIGFFIGVAATSFVIAMALEKSDEYIHLENLKKENLKLEIELKKLELRKLKGE